MTVGERICKYRKDNKMTMEDIGKYLGVQRSVVNKYEKDRIDIKLSTITSLCTLFGISYTELLEDENSEVYELITAYKAANNDEEPNEAQLTAYLNSYLASTYGTAVSADTTKGYVYIASDNYVVYNNN